MVEKSRPVISNGKKLFPCLLQKNIYVALNHQPIKSVLTVRLSYIIINFVVFSIE